MVCARCHAENREGARFCRGCGEALDRTCRACGATVDAASRFCDRCGEPMPSPAGAPAFGAPVSYTPKHLIDKILSTRRSLVGERRLVTVLFVDVSGFVHLSETLDPEDVHTLMSAAFDIMLEEVHRYEGTVNQFLGDGIMALFGAPIAHEDHPQRAVHAALGVRDALARYAERLERERGVVFRTRQGLNTGLVVVGSIGNDLRMDYTAVGDTTNVAARLQQAAAPGTIVISETLHRLVEGYFVEQELGAVTVKGKAEQVRTWEVLAARVTRTRLEVEAERGLTPFIGRERELDTLFACLDKARAGHGQMVFVVGEPGVGKSRLLVEFQRRLGDRARWVEGHAVAYGRSIPFHPLLDLMKRTFEIKEGDSEATIIDRIETSVLALGEELRPTIPFLRYMLSVDPGDASVPTMDPRQRRAAITDAVRRLLVRAAEIEPLVVVYEDIQWGDETTTDVMRAVADVIPTSRVLNIVTYRTGFAQPFGERSYHTRITLGVLSDDETERLALAMLSTDRLPEEVRALIASRAEGNPFFVEELVKSLLDVGALRRADDGYVVAPGQSQRLVVPETIQDIIMARIDRLDDAPRLVLQIAAVIGREFTRRLLDSLVDDPEIVEPSVRELERLELIYKKTLFPELAYTFHHALTQEVAYNSLLLQGRRELHHRIGTALEQLAGDRLAEQYAVLAHHFSRAEDDEKASEYLSKAADKAALAFANREARMLYEQALATSGALDGAARAGIFRKLATVTQYLGDPDASLRYAEEALELYTRLGDKRGAVAMHLFIDVLYTWQWDGAREDRGLAHIESAARLVDTDPDSVEKGLVFQRIGHRYLHRSQPTTTIMWARRAVDMFADLGVPMGTSLGTALVYAGQVAEGISYSEGNWEPVSKAGVPVVLAVFGHELTLALALVRDVPRAKHWGERVLARVAKASPVFEAMLQRPLALVYTLAGDLAKAEQACAAVEAIERTTLLGCIYDDALSVGFHYLRRGQWEKGREYLERLMPLYQERNNLVAVAACCLGLGSLAARSGERARGRELLERAVEIARTGGNVLLELWALPVLAELDLADRRVADAETRVGRGLDVLRTGGDWRGVAASVHLAAGMLAAAREEWPAALASLDTATAINVEFELAWDEARTRRERATVHVARGTDGDRGRAREDLTSALAIFRRVGAEADAADAAARLEAI